jgi:hypothetical protein
MFYSSEWWSQSFGTRGRKNLSSSSSSIHQMMKNEKERKPFDEKQKGKEIE